MKRITRHSATLAFATFSLAALASSSVAWGGTKKADAELAKLEEVLPGELLNDPRTLIDLSQNLGGAKTKVIKSGTIPGGGAARAVQVTKAPDQAWQVSAGMKLDHQIARGDVVTVGFYARALPDANGVASGRIGLRIQQNVSPWAGFMDTGFDIGPEWQWYEMAGVSNVTLPRGTAAASLVLGSKAQNLEIGQMIVVKGANAIAAALPEPAITLPPQIANVAGQLINRPQDGPWNFYGIGGSQQRIADRTIYLGKASRVTVDAKSDKPPQLEIEIPINIAVAAGDRYLVAVAARTVSTGNSDGKASFAVHFQSIKPPYSSFADNVLRPGTNWQLLQLRTTATLDLPKSEGVFKLIFTVPQDVVDIGPVYILKLD